LTDRLKASSAKVEVVEDGSDMIALSSSDCAKAGEVVGEVGGESNMFTLSSSDVVIIKYVRTYLLSPLKLVITNDFFQVSLFFCFIKVVLLLLINRISLQKKNKMHQSPLSFAKQNKVYYPFKAKPYIAKGDVKIDRLKTAGF